MTKVGQAGVNIIERPAPTFAATSSAVTIPLGLRLKNIRNPPPLPVTVTKLSIAAFYRNDKELT
jgi:hypothetical protein